MTRTSVCSALILRNRPSGESNREVWLLTPESGLIRTTVFGGPRSRLRAHAEPFHSGQAWIYHDPVKDFNKLNDFDVKSWRPGLRELYERTMTSTAVAQTILATHAGGGAWESALNLAEEALDALESANADLCKRILIHFLWRWAGFLGSRPQLEYCFSCGKTSAPDSSLWYSAHEGGVLCEDCGQGQSFGLLFIGPGCRRWLARVGPLEPAQLGPFTMDNKLQREIMMFTTAILAEILGKRLESWDWQ